MPKIHHEKLEELYQRYNRREFVSPDPLQFLYEYPDPKDREIVGLIASSFAYGNVAQILRSGRSILKPMGESPHAYLTAVSEEELKKTYSAFIHRWHRGNDLVALLRGIQRALSTHGSLENCFIQGLKPADATVLPALSRFVQELTQGLPGLRKNLLPLPERGSACKRLHMYLRWMVRQDQVDPGGWSHVSPSQLLVPIDTHMHRISRLLKLTRRKQANQKTAQDITLAFKSALPEDPVRYDFALTRLGIRKEANLPEFINFYWDKPAPKINKQLF